MTDLKNDITAPLRLAQGSHAKGSGFGCAMNVMSWEKGDLTITDIPDNSDPVLAVMVQHINDGICKEGDKEKLLLDQCNQCDFIEERLESGTVVSRERAPYTESCRKEGHTQNYFYIALLCSNCAVEVLQVAHRTPGTVISDPVRYLTVWYDVIERLLKERHEHYLEMLKVVDKDLALEWKLLLDLVEVALEFHPRFKSEVLRIASVDVDDLDTDEELTTLRSAYEMATKAVFNPDAGGITRYYEDVNSIMTSVVSLTWCGESTLPLLHVAPGGIQEIWNEWDRYGRDYANHVIDVFEEVSGCNAAPEIDIDKLNEALTKMGVKEPVSAK